MRIFRFPIIVFVSAIALLYGVVPLLFSPPEATGEYELLSVIAGVASVSVIAGGGVYRIFDETVTSGFLPFKLRLSPVGFNFVVWTTFVVFVTIVWSTAEGIPIVHAALGADAETLAYLRERFLKARDGWQALLVYVNALLCGALLPYCLAQLFVLGSRARWALLGAFVLYCISFIEKAFFFKALLPLLFLVAIGVVGSRKSLKWIVVTSIGLLALVSVLAGVGGDGEGELRSAEPYVSAAYRPSSPFDHLLWRSTAVPVFTAADSIAVIRNRYDSSPLMGATSSLLAGVFGLERVALEREVFAYQWGQNETGTGSANSVYFIEAYANFGWIGVVLISMLIGLLLSWMVRGGDVALAALWPLFAFALFSSGFIGILLSNGFILVFLAAALCRFAGSPKRHREICRSEPDATHDCRS